MFIIGNLGVIRLIRLQIILIIGDIGVIRLRRLQMVLIITNLGVKRVSRRRYVLIIADLRVIRLNSIVWIMLRMGCGIRELHYRLHKWLLIEKYKWLALYILVIIIYHWIVYGC